MDNRRYAILPNDYAYAGDSGQAYSKTLHIKQWGQVLPDDNREFEEALQVLEYDGNATGDLLAHVQGYHYDLTNTQAIGLLQQSYSPLYATD